MMGAMDKISLLATLSCAAAAFAEPAPTPASIVDKQLARVESDFVSLAEAMPAEKYAFRPSGDGFKDVRTFAQQVGHVGGAMNMFAAALLGEPAGLTRDDEKNGPPSLKSKADFVAYVKAAFARAHRSIATLNDKNLTETVDNKVIPGHKPTRLAAATFFAWHAYDHYGQLAVYLRQNGIVPPASKN
jgi:hypothetical protein